MKIVPCALSRRQAPRKLRHRPDVTPPDAAGIMQAVSVLHAETLADGETLQILYEKLQKMEAEKVKTAREKDEAWYLGYANRIAGLIKEDPSCAEGEMLQKFCDAMKIDYIMVFDQNGRERACSRDYTDFTLKTGKGDCWDDFSRLLMGVPSIIRETETDTLTGLERQLIGVSLSLPGTDRHGAMVMALYPDTILPPASGYSTFAQLRSLMPEGTSCFFADAENGNILYASDSFTASRTPRSCSVIP